MINEITTNLPTYQQFTGEMYRKQEYPRAVYDAAGMMKVAQDAEEAQKFLAAGYTLLPPVNDAPLEAYGDYPHTMVHPPSGNKIEAKDRDWESVYLSLGWKLVPPPEPDDDEEEEEPPFAKRRPGRPRKTEAA